MTSDPISAPSRKILRTGLLSSTRQIAFFISGLLTWIVCVFHMSTLPRDFPQKIHTLTAANLSLNGAWYDRSSFGVNHLFLWGSEEERANAEGKLTLPRIHTTEKILFDEFERFFPNILLRWTFLIGAMRWFAGIERFFPEYFIRYARTLGDYGDPHYNYVLDPQSRGIAYHGIHEVGQLFVDIEREDFGCTAFAVRRNGRWIIGRNFDFEVGRYFDIEKIVKWHFPKDAQPYLSIIWPGMIGVVTGVNQSGVMIAINAAGTSDFARYGTPSTIVVLDALRKAQNAQAAVDIISEASVFISDLFVVSDAQNAFRIEKTPLRTRVIPMTTDSVVTNHFIHKDFADDPINRYRQEELTSAQRELRGKFLLTQHHENTATDSAPHQMLSFLRDRRNIQGKTLPLGDRRAIDALIATHSVIFDSSNMHLYISEGPALVGRMMGVDLRKSFAARRPVALAPLPSDPEITPEKFAATKLNLTNIARVETNLNQGECAMALKNWESVNSFEHDFYYRTAGLLADRCQHDPAQARIFYEKALTLGSAYPKHRKALERRLLVP